VLRLKGKGDKKWNVKTKKGVEIRCKRGNRGPRREKREKLISKEEGSIPRHRYPKHLFAKGVEETLMRDSFSNKPSSVDQRG